MYIIYFTRFTVPSEIKSNFKVQTKKFVKALYSDFFFSVLKVNKKNNACFFFPILLLFSGYERFCQLSCTDLYSIFIYVS